MDEIENNDYNDKITTYTVEVLAREQNEPEGDESKAKEFQNLIENKVFEEVDNNTQERIGIKWVITEKDKVDLL